MTSMLDLQALESSSPMAADEGGGASVDGLSAELPLELLSREDDAVVDHAGEEDVVEVGYPMAGGRKALLVRQQRARGLSFQLWPAASALCGYLEHRYAGEHGLEECRALELGAGTGMVGIMAALLGAQVVLTDLAHVAPNLLFNVALNEAEVVRAGGSATVRALRWGEAADVRGLSGAFDLILASDVVYYDTLFQPLLRTLRWLVDDEPSVSPSGDGEALVPCRRQPPLLLLAHLRRWKKDAHFFKMASKYFHVRVVHRNPPPEGARVGVSVYSLTKKEHTSPSSVTCHGKGRLP